MLLLDPDEIKERADAIRLSQSELARRLEMAQTTVNSILQKKQDPRLSTLQKMAFIVLTEEQKLLSYLMQRGVSPTDKIESVYLIRPSVRARKQAEAAEDEATAEDQTAAGQAAEAELTEAAE